MTHLPLRESRRPMCPQLGVERYQKKRSERFSEWNPNTKNKKRPEFLSGIAGRPNSPPPELLEN